MTIWNVKGRCGDCKFSYKGHVASSGSEFPAIVCPNCAKPIKKGVTKGTLGSLTRNCAAIYTRLLGQRLDEYAAPYSVQALYPDLPKKKGTLGPTLDVLLALDETDVEVDFVHPEIRPGEVFFRNCTRALFDSLDLSSKRFGQAAYDGRGNLLPRDDDWRPVFLRVAELDARAVTLERLLKQFPG